MTTTDKRVQATSQVLDHVERAREALKEFSSRDQGSGRAGKPTCAGRVAEVGARRAAQGNRDYRTDEVALLTNGVHRSAGTTTVGPSSFLSTGPAAPFASSSVSLPFRRASSSRGGSAPCVAARAPPSSPRTSRIYAKRGRDEVTVLTAPNELGNNGRRQARPRFSGNATAHLSKADTGHVAQCRCRVAGLSQTSSSS